MDLSRYLAAVRQGCVDLHAVRYHKDSPSPPPAPDYAGAATAQGAANKEAALTTGMINNPNINNPYGQQVVTWNGDQPTITQTLSPEQQTLYNTQVQTKGLLGGLGVTGAESLKGIVGKPVDFSGAPTTGSYDQTRQKVIDSMMSRANEDYGKRTDQTNSDLISAGIRPGTKAYADKMQMIERSRNDANAAAEVAGGNAASQAYSMDSDRRKQAITELLTKRQTPLNEISALMSGTQVNNPFAGNLGYQAGANVQPAPAFQAMQAQSGAANNIYNADVASNNANTAGLTALAGAAITAFF